MILSKLRDLISSRRALRDEEFAARMEEAEQFGREQLEAAIAAKARIRRERDERPMGPTGMPTIDLVRGTYDPDVRIYRGRGRRDT